MPEDISTLNLHGATVEVTTHGAGRNILYLPSGMWFADESAFVRRLATLGRVTAPTPPGFGSGRIDGPSNVDDLAYMHLDLIDALKLRDVVLVGASFGGWIAAEMAIKSCAAISGIVLIDPLGIKVGDRSTRDIADLYGLPDVELLSRAYVDASTFQSDVKQVDDAELARRMRARESLARYGWSPFMHDPKLAGRLHRVFAPTLFVWGARDGIVSPDYGRAYASRVPGAKFVEIAGAAHFPQIEQPGATIEAITAFAGAARAGH